MKLLANINKFGTQKIFSRVLYRLCSRLLSYQISRKTNELNLKVTKNLILGPILGHLAQIWAPNFFLWVLPLLVIRQCSKLSFYPIEKMTNTPNLRKWQKNSILDPILTDLTQIWVQKLFSWTFPLYNKYWIKIVIIYLIQE